LAVVHLALQGAGIECEKVRIAVWDSTELKPGDTIPAISKELRLAYRRPTLEMFMKGKPSEEEAYVKKGVVTLEGIGGEEIKLEKADVVIMNPPFTRQERIPARYKLTLEKRLKEYHKYIHGQLGLYGYFVLLADKFLKENGRMALVLPATVLRLKSALGIRKLLTDNYSINYVITTWQRAAFSEGAQFREILLIATKTKKNDTPCIIVKLKRIPKNLDEARDIAIKIKSASRTLPVNHILTTEEMSIRVLSQQALKDNFENLFIYISCHNEEIEKTWEEMFNKMQKSGKFVTFMEVLKKINGRIFEGARARSQLLHAPIGSTFILHDALRADKSQDRWVLKKEKAESLIAENLFTKTSLTIPRKSVCYGLRRLSGVNSIDLTNNLDFVVIDAFPDLDNFFVNEDVSRIRREMSSWKEYILRRLSKLAIAFRFDMSAKGTTLFAWYSSVPMAGCGVVWNITGVDDTYAKILALWFNSTVNALQIYLKRVETRGAWMELHKYVIDDLFALDPTKLSAKEKNELLQLFESVKDVKFPSFLTQLKEKDKNRMKIDKAFLKIMGFTEKETKQILDFLYPALANEIEQLKALMKG